MFQGLFKRLLLAALAVLLVAVLVGPSGATEPRAVTKIITIPAAAFHPYHPGMEFYNYGYTLTTDVGSFMAPLFFESRSVTVNDITLYATDNNHPGDVCVFLKRTTPWNGSMDSMGQVCSTGTGNTPRHFTQTSLPIRKITGSHGPYLLVQVPIDNTDLALHAVRINYTYTP